MSGPASVLDDDRRADARARRPASRSGGRSASAEPRVDAAPPVRPFAEALARPGRVNVIAELKRRSPSRGAIREDLAPADVARGLRGGRRGRALGPDRRAASSADAWPISRRCGRRRGLPVLRKDFVVDPWQVWEARARRRRRGPPHRGRSRRRRAALAARGRRAERGPRRARRGARPPRSSTAPSPRAPASSA